MIGIVTGMAFEAQAVARAARRRGLPAPPVAVGAGRAAAVDAAEDLVARGARGLISLGFCGGLAPGLAPGTAVLASRVVAADHAHVPTDHDLDAARRALVSVAGLTCRPLAHSDAPVSTADAKGRLAGRTGAAAVDMESDGVAAVAAGAGLPWLALRLVLDDAQEALPPAALAGFTPGRGTAVGPVMAALVGRPQDMPALMALARRRSAVTRALVTVCMAGLPDFGLSRGRPAEA